jgi:hypothetical protein
MRAGVTHLIMPTLHAFAATAGQGLLGPHGTLAQLEMLSVFVVRERAGDNQAGPRCAAAATAGRLPISPLTADGR